MGCINFTLYDPPEKTYISPRTQNGGAQCKSIDIRKEIADFLSSYEGHELWDDMLAGTNPGNYGYEVDEVSVDATDLRVDVPSLTFTFKDLYLSFYAQLGASNDKDGYNEHFRFNQSGSGEFAFEKGSKKIKVNNIRLDGNCDLELYGDSKLRLERNL